MKKSMVRRVGRIFLLSLCVGTLTAATAYAAGDDPLAIVNNLSDFIPTAEEREKGNYAYEPLESQPEGISYELKGFEYEVGEGEIFFLGDNTRNSIDSRYKQGASHLDGLYKKTDIYGIVPQWSIDHRAFLEIWTKLFSSGGNGGT